MTELSPEEWGNRYRNIRGNCEALTGRLRTLVVDSFTEKISRKRAKYKNPLREITDFVGIRIITYYLEDVVRVGEISPSSTAISLARSFRYPSPGHPFSRGTEPVLRTR